MVFILVSINIFSSVLSQNVSYALCLHPAGGCVALLDIQSSVQDPLGSVGVWFAKHFAILTVKGAPIAADSNRQYLWLVNLCSGFWHGIGARCCFWDWSQREEGAAAAGQGCESKALLVHEKTSQSTRQHSSLLYERYQLKSLPHLAFAPVQQRRHVTGTVN